MSKNRIARNGTRPAPTPGSAETQIPFALCPGCTRCPDFRVVEAIVGYGMTPGAAHVAQTGAKLECLACGHQFSVTGRGIASESKAPAPQTPAEPLTTPE